MLTGSVPPRPALPSVHQPPLPALPIGLGTTSLKPTVGPAAPRPPVYATRETLERLAAAYGGGLWPELGSWAVQDKDGRGRPEKGAVSARGLVEDVNNAVGVVFSPYVTPSPASAATGCHGRPECPACGAAEH